MVSETRKYQFITFMVSVILFIILLLTLIISYFKVRDYTIVSAELVAVSKHYGDTYDTDMMLYKFETYEYQLNGIQYQSTKSAIWFIPHRIGNHYMIRCNPANPTDIENTAQKITILGVLCVLFLWIFIMGKEVFKR